MAAFFLTPFDLGANIVTYVNVTGLLAFPSLREAPVPGLCPEPVFPAIPWYWYYNCL